MSKANIVAAAAFGVVAALGINQYMNSITPVEQPTVASHVRTQDTGHITGGYLEDFRIVATSPSLTKTKSFDTALAAPPRPDIGCQAVCM